MCALTEVRVLLAFQDLVKEGSGSLVPLEQHCCWRDIPVVPQKGDSTVQFLNKVVDEVVHDRCPWSRQCRAVAFTDKVVDILVLAFRTLEVPQNQSSTGLNDNFEAKWVLFWRILRQISDSPKRG